MSSPPRGFADAPRMLRPGEMVILCALALLMVGAVMVNSAAMEVTPIDLAPGGDAPAQSDGVTVGSILFSRSSAYMGMAVGAMLIVSRLPVRRLAGWLSPEEADDKPRRPGLVLIAAAVGLVALLSMVYWPGLERQVNGSHRWVALPVPGLESFQPSEVAKWVLPLLLAWYAAVRGPMMRSFLFGLLPALTVLGIVSAAIVVEDLGTGVLVAGAGCIVLLAAGARLWHFLMFVPVAMLGVVVAILDNPYRIERITAFLDPYADPRGSGYHMIQSMANVAGGGFFGRGLGHGLQKFGYLPEDTTDFLFAIICEELGFAGALLVIGLYGMLIWSAAAIIRRTPSTVLKLAGLGVLATVALQALINLVVVTGLGPTKGIALPLLSSGGTGWILTAASLGLLVAIDRSSKAIEAETLLTPELADDEVEEDAEIDLTADDWEDEPEPVVEQPRHPRVIVPGPIEIPAPRDVSVSEPAPKSAAELKPAQPQAKPRYRLKYRGGDDEGAAA